LRGWHCARFCSRPAPEPRVPARPGAGVPVGLGRLAACGAAVRRLQRLPPRPRGLLPAQPGAGPLPSPTPTPTLPCSARRDPHAMRDYPRRLWVRGRRLRDWLQFGGHIGSVSRQGWAHGRREASHHAGPKRGPGAGRASAARTTSTAAGRRGCRTPTMRARMRPWTTSGAPPMAAQG